MNFFAKYGVSAWTLLSLCFVLLGCTGKIHKENLSREEAVRVIVDFPLPASATHVFYYDEAGGLQSLQRFIRFDVSEEELQSAVETMIVTYNTTSNQHLAFAEKQLSLVPLEESGYPQRLAKEIGLSWWDPEHIQHGYYRGELRSYAIRMWIDKGAQCILTTSSFEALRGTAIPEDLLGRLKRLKDREFMLETDFVEAIETEIGKEQTNTYKEVILHATVKRTPRIYLFQTD